MNEINCTFASSMQNNFYCNINDYGHTKILKIENTRIALNKDNCKDDDENTNY